MSRKDVGDYFIFVPRKTLLAEKNGWEGKLPDVTRGSELNNDKDSKKVLDTGAVATNLRLCRLAMDSGDSAQLHI